MHVLMLAQYLPPDKGGASTRASNMIKGLRTKGCNVTVVTAFPHYPHGKVPTKYRGKPLMFEESDGVRVIRVWVPSIPHNNIVNRMRLHLCFMISSLFALPFVGKVDVIWATNPNLFAFFPAVVYSFVKRRLIVRNADDLWPEVFYELGLVRSGLMRKLLDLLTWFSYTVPVAITPISAGYKQRIVAKYHVLPEKVHVIEVGVDSVKPLEVDQESTTNRFVVMYSGVLGLGYDFDIVLEAARILAENKDIVFVIRGFGELATKLQKQIMSLNLGNVVLDTDFLPEDKLSALLRSANVFLLPMVSLHFVDAGLPTKIFEYQSYKKPIICVSSGESARYIKATESGLIVKPKDAHGLAEAVIMLYKDAKLASELGCNGWQHVSKHMISEKVGERMFRLFKSLC